MATLQEKYEAGKKAYASSLRANKGQAGGTKSIPSKAKLDAFKENIRKKFFDNRKEINDQRLMNRVRTETTLNQFKDSLEKKGRTVTGLTTESGLPVFRSETPGGRTVASVSQDLARRFGPTPSDIVQDIGFGIGRLAKNFGLPVIGTVQKGLGLLQDLYQNVTKETPPPPQVGTNFPVPGADTRDFFSSSGIASVDPNSVIREGEFDNNALVNIARQSGPFEELSFQELLKNATVQNTKPSVLREGEFATRVGDALQTASDAINAARAGVNVNTPLGNLNINPLNEALFLNNQINPNLNFGGNVNREGEFNVGLGAALPNNFRLSVGGGSGDLAGLSLSNNFISTIPGVKDFVPSLNLSSRGDASLGLNTTIDPLKMLGIGSALPFNIDVGGSVTREGEFTPNINFNVPFNSGAGLGFMLN